MIILNDAIGIDFPPELIFHFFLRFKENYLAWHPDHVKCQYLIEGQLRKGSIIYIEEYLHGKLHKFKFKITKLEPNSRIDYKIGAGMKGEFIIESRGPGSLFTAGLYFGNNIPLIGRLIDGFFKLFMSRQLEEMKKHMVEEGENLKMMLEKNDARFFSTVAH